MPRVEWRPVVGIAVWASSQRRQRSRLCGTAYQCMARPDDRALVLIQFGGVIPSVATGQLTLA